MTCLPSGWGGRLCVSPPTRALEKTTDQVCASARPSVRRRATGRASEREESALLLAAFLFQEPIPLSLSCPPQALWPAPFAPLAYDNRCAHLAPNGLGTLARTTDQRERASPFLGALPPPTPSSLRAPQTHLEAARDRDGRALLPSIRTSATLLASSRGQFGPLRGLAREGQRARLGGGETGREGGCSPLSSFSSRAPIAPSLPLWLASAHVVL